MKKGIRIFVGLILACGAAVSLLIFYLNPIIANLRPQITLLLSNAIGQQVKLGEISARLFPSVAIEVSDIRLPTETKENQLSIQRIALDTSLSGLLYGKVVVNRISISGGQATIVREIDGAITLAGIASSKIKNGAVSREASLETKVSESPKVPANSPDFDSLKVQISELALDHFNLTFIDKKAPQMARFLVSDLSGLMLGINNKQISNVSLRGSVLGGTKDNFSFTGGISLSESSSIMNPKINGSVKIVGINVNELAQLLVSYGMKLEGKSFGESLELGVNLNSTTEQIIADLKLTLTPNPNGLEQISSKILFDGHSVEVRDANITLGGQKLDLVGRIESLDRPEITGTLSGETFNATELLNALGFGDEKLRPASIVGIQCAGSYSVRAKSGKLKLLAQRVDTYGTSISNISIVLNLAPDSLEIESAVLSAFGGQVTLQGERGLGEKQTTSAKLSATNLTMENVSKAFAPTSKHPITGNLSQLRADLSGNSQALKDSLAGEMSAEVLKGTIEGINILGGTLGEVGEIPGLKSTLQAFVPVEYKSVLEGNSTPFDSLRIDTSVESKKVQLRNVNIQHALYILQGQGWYGFDGDFDIDAQLKLTPLLAQGMVAKQKKLEFLLDQNKNIVIPVKISRHEGKTIILPDASRLFSVAAKNSAKEAATKALDKIAPGLGKAAGVLDQLFK